MTATEVEGKAAIYMNENGITEGSIFHNNPNGICPWCNNSLPTILNGGTVLQVVPSPLTY